MTEVTSDGMGVCPVNVPGDGAGFYALMPRRIKSTSWPRFKNARGLRPHSANPARRAARIAAPVIAGIFATRRRALGLGHSQGAIERSASAADRPKTRVTWISQQTEFWGISVKSAK